MRAVDGEELLGVGDEGFGVGLVQEGFGDAPGAVSEAFALGVEPYVEGRVDAVKLFEKVGVEEGEGAGMGGGGAEHLFDVDPDHAGAERDTITVD